MTSRTPAVWRRGLLLGGLMLSAGAAGAQTSPAAGHGPYFPADAPWYQDVSAAPVDAESAAVINWLASVGGWGGGRLQIGFSIGARGGAGRRTIDSSAGGLGGGASAPFKTSPPTDPFFPDVCVFEQVPLPAN